MSRRFGVRVNRVPRFREGTPERQGYVTPSVRPITPPSVLPTAHPEPVWDTPEWTNDEHDEEGCDDAS